MFEKETQNKLINQIRTYVFICTYVDRTSEQSGKFLNIYFCTRIYTLRTYFRVQYYPTCQNLAESDLKENYNQFSTEPYAYVC